MIDIIQQAPKADYKFSIIIPSWNNLEMLKLCIRSIQSHSKYAHELIIHINEGNDGSVEWLKKNVSATVTHSPENLGICVPLNFCASLIQSEYVCYFNDDMYALPNWDDELSSAIDQRKDNLFFYSASQIQPRDFWDPSIIKNRDYGSSVETFREQDLLEDYQSFQHYDWSGATWPPNVVHKQIWDMVGGYSIEFSPGMYSDPDFSMKLWQIGVRDFKGFGSSRVYHFESKSTKRIKHNPGAIQFLNKWGMTARTFGKHFLHRGEAYSGPLTKPEDSLSYRLDKIRGNFKKLIS